MKKSLGIITQPQKKAPAGCNHITGTFALSGYKATNSEVWIITEQALVRPLDTRMQSDCE